MKTQTKKELSEEIFNLKATIVTMAAGWNKALETIKKLKKP